MTIEVSLIVCTYNRCEVLEVLLESVKAQQGMENNTWECLIIDNNSNDQTKDVVRRYQNTINNLHYHYEPQQGKGFALNRAVKEAKGSLLCFTDDDVTLDNFWLNKYLIAAYLNPGHDWFGGVVEPLWPNGKPDWYKNSKRKEYYNGYFVRYKLFDKSGPYDDKDQYPFGASVAIRKNVFSKVAGFRTDIGVSGKIRGAGMDIDFIDRVVDSGFKGYYVHDVVCYHRLDDKRLKLRSFLLFGYGRGLNHYHILKRNNRGSVKSLVEQLGRGFVQLIMMRDDNYRVTLINTGIEAGKLRAHYLDMKVKKRAHGEKWR